MQKEKAGSNALEIVQISFVAEEDNPNTFKVRAFSVQS